jgi:hypothetical protein
MGGVWLNLGLRRAGVDARERGLHGEGGGDSHKLVLQPEYGRQHQKLACHAPLWVSRAAQAPPPPPPSGTDWTRLVLPPY